MLGGNGDHCGEDPHCINRLHPAIPMVARALPGRTIVMHTRNAGDRVLDPASGRRDSRPAGSPGSKVHPMIGPVHIEGAERGDVLAVTILAIEPGAFGYSIITPSGWIADTFPVRDLIFWRMDANGAVSDAIPGVRIPDGSFPGVVTVLPGVEEHRRILDRESALSAAGGMVSNPEPVNAAPAVCGPDGAHADACLRTFPPREHGGNMDIRYIGRGATVYLPCYLDGCGLAVGDLHYAQGDGEVAGTAIEMDATVTLTPRLIKRDAQRPNLALSRGPHYEGPSRLLDIPSRRFYATTGFPFKAKGEMPPQMGYLKSPKAADLENLSNDLNLAVRNALLEMVDYISATYGLTREQAYLVATVAVDVRIGQLVDAPNVGATAVLPLDIFEK
ncbi:acetamidase/formamidase family protein [bacterium]|nr:acetamidase/formamidase family protein [bacterium]